MLAKICSFSNFGSLNPNLTWVFTYGNSIANFRAARYRKIGNPEIGNTVNEDKTKIIGITWGRDRKETFEFVYNEKRLEVVNEFTYLGICFTKRRTDQ